MLTSNARSLDELLAELTPEAYAASDGSYTSLPTWGEPTDEVVRRIRASCGDGDIVSWDTTAEPHRYLMRLARPAEPGGCVFRIETADTFSADLAEQRQEWAEQMDRRGEEMA